jgi:hypothetical protein
MSRFENRIQVCQFNASISRSKLPMNRALFSIAPLLPLADLLTLLNWAGHKTTSKRPMNDL